MYKRPSNKPPDGWGLRHTAERPRRRKRHETGRRETSEGEGISAASANAGPAPNVCCLNSAAVVRSALYCWLYCVFFYFVFIIPAFL